MWILMMMPEFVLIVIYWQFCATFNYLLFVMVAAHKRVNNDAMPSHVPLSHTVINHNNSICDNHNKNSIHVQIKTLSRLSPTAAVTWSQQLKKKALLLETIRFREHDLNILWNLSGKEPLRSVDGIVRGEKKHL